MKNQKSKSPSAVKAILLPLAIRYLSYRPRSRQEMANYLHRKLTSIDKSGQLSAQHSAIVENLIAKLTRMQLLDDVDFCSQWIQARLNQGKGPLIIKSELRFKGVSSHVIDNHLNQISTKQWLDSAQRQLNKKTSLWRHQSILIQRQKAYQYLRRRGYSSPTISQAIDAIYPSR